MQRMNHAQDLNWAKVDKVTYLRADGFTLVKEDRSWKGFDAQGRYVWTYNSLTAGKCMIDHDASAPTFGMH